MESPHYYINSGLGIESVQFMHLCIQLNTKLFLNIIWCLPTPIYFHFLFESRKSVSSHASKYKRKKKLMIFVPYVLPNPPENPSTLLLELQFQGCLFFCYIFFTLIPRETLVYHHNKRSHWLHHLCILFWDLDLLLIWCSVTQLLIQT